MVAMDRQRLFHTNCSSFLSFTYKERTRHSSNKRGVFPVLTGVGDLCVAYKQLDSFFEGGSYIAAEKICSYSSAGS